MRGLNYFLCLMIFLFFAGCKTNDSDDDDKISTDLVLGDIVELGQLPVSHTEWTIKLYGKAETLFAYLRYSGEVLFTMSKDSGSTWTVPAVTDFKNNLGVHSGRMIRQSMVGKNINMYSSSDGKSWEEKTVFTLPETLDESSNTQYTGAVTANGDIWFAVYYRLKEDQYPNHRLVTLKSVDGGVTFEAKPPKEVSDYFMKTFLDMFVYGRYVAINCTYFYGRHGGESMLTSHDYGDTYEDIQSANFFRAAVDPQNPLKVYYCRYGENTPYSWTYTFHRTSDFGKTSDFSEDAPACRLVFRNNRLVVRLEKNGVRQSADEAVTWSEYVNLTGTVEKETRELGIIETDKNKLLFMWADGDRLYVRKEK